MLEPCLLQPCFHVAGSSYSCGKSAAPPPSSTLCHCPKVKVSSHNVNSHNFNLRVSNPRTIAYVHFNMPFDSSNLPWTGPIFQNELLKTGRASHGEQPDEHNTLNDIDYTIILYTILYCNMLYYDLL